MSFWQTKAGKKKWVQRPESHAKNLLQTFLRGRFEDKISQFEEITAGAGKADIFIIFADGKKVVIELKICGDGYSLNYAKEGWLQLIHYMENRKSKIGYLVVFDSRKKDFSKNIPEYEKINDLEMKSFIIDVRPYVK